MIKRVPYLKTILLFVFCVSFATAFASFSIFNINFDKIKDKEKGKAKIEKYSLTHIRRSPTFFSLSSIGRGIRTFDYINKNNVFVDRFQLNNIQEENNNSAASEEVRSTIRINTGNTTIAYPFNYKIKASPFRMFKTPTPPSR